MDETTKRKAFRVGYVYNALLMIEAIKLGSGGLVAFFFFVSNFKTHLITF